ncbi:thermonuclease family protein [Pseudobutyrivibrio sp.]|uniref:thermonuclease family protein n=1 Tax=Pseudobutyrivibrio sp. TaxID=2014367 RepID=UPI0025D3B323|nr:thermonuclease family protein [Pseudobutyrivibrio sp.]MBR5649882.1 thermonuclease family protein [Pseudobutyrivibrio sp.]
MKNNNRWQRIVGIIVAIVVCLVSTEYLNSQNETDINENNVETVDNQETNLDAVKFVRTVDGDTIIVEDSTGAHKRVRMIGIDTPESVAQEEERNNEYGVMASDYTKDLLSKAGTVYLEYDIDSDDQYDRVLAYVWLEDVDDTFNVENIKNSMVNAIIVENGYGIAKKYEPTVAHDDVLAELMAEANEENIGLWQYQGFRDLWK